MSILLHAAQSAPAITSFSPTSGGPGTRVTISGTGFNGVTVVTFNNRAADFVPVSSTQISATVPVGSTTGPITVTTPTGTAISPGNFVVTPRVDDFSPANGPVGTPVTVNGANFENATTVKFNGANADFVVTAGNQLQATVPAGAITGPISVTTPAGTGASTKSFVVTGNEPSITTFTPTSGSPGTVVTISGQRFAGATAVIFNTNAAASFTVTAPTQISAIVPAGATTGRISVVTPGGTGVSANVFTVGPSISDFAPTIGQPGAQVTINGAGFTGATAVRFNGTNASFTVTSASQVSATVPANATSGPISVITPAGTAVSANHFTVITRTPVITDFSPTFASVGTQVTIVGENFVGTTSVKFNNTATTNYSVTAPNQLQAIVPPGATNGPISVTNPAGTGVSSNTFTVIGPGPLIIDFSPIGGAPGTRVTINGANFVGATNVAFNLASTTNFTVTASTQMEAVVPTNATSGLISVFAPAGAGSSTNSFFVAPRIFNFSPATGAEGTVVTLNGENLVGASVVLFNGREAVFTVDSQNTVRATVPVGATTGPISLATPGGAIATTNLFGVIAAADLAVTTTASPDPVTEGKNLTYTVTVTNRGPNTATGVVLTNSLSPKVKFSSAAASSGNCSYFNGTVTCNVGNLTNQAAVKVTIVVNPQSAGVVTNTAIVKGSEADPDMSNNTAATQTTVDPAPAPSLSIARSGRNVVIGWPASATGYSLQVTSNLFNNWSAVTNVPVRVGDQINIGIDASSGSRFFRLQRP